MSKNAKRYQERATRRHMLEDAEEADFEHFGGNLNSVADEAAYEGWFVRRASPLKLMTCRITKEEYLKVDGKTIDWNHLSGLVRQAVADSGFDNLPYNIENMVHAGVAPGSYPRWASPAGIEKVVGKVRRFCGWLRAVRGLPALRKVVERTQSGRGMCSPRTTLNIWQLAAKYPSPGRLERKLWAVRQRADAILTAYEGQKVSWASIAQALLVADQVGKAAVIAVAMSISGESFYRYRHAREWLVEYHLCKVVDTSDGVIARREAEPRLTKCGIAVYRIAVPWLNRRGRQVGVWFQFLVRSAGGRTYHSDWGGPVEALCQALKAWKEQDKLTRKEADLVGFLKGEHGFCPLVVRQDSYSAGNCSAGTEEWVRRQGWANREWIPAQWLIPYLTNSHVRGVAVKLYERHISKRVAA